MCDTWKPSKKYARACSDEDRMFYLPKYVGEFAVINDDIEITVVDTPGRSARLGCVSPQGASVLRQELCKIIQKESRESAQVCVDLLVAPMEAPNKAGE